MTDLSLTDLERFIVSAKAVTYVGGGQRLLPYRFLGGFHHVTGDLTYTDTSRSDLRAFTGQEWIERGSQRVAQTALASYQPNRPSARARAMMFF